MTCLSHVWKGYRCTKCGISQRDYKLAHTSLEEPEEMTEEQAEEIRDQFLNANETQVGGTHYKKDGEQHWDKMYSLYGPAWFIGNITKYVGRYAEKNGREDLLKAEHYLKKLKEENGVDMLEGFIWSMELLLDQLIKAEERT